jgi:hypothetical protein
MTQHVSIRLAWHDSGWNGRICRNPRANTYCVGQYSFPGDRIAQERDLEWEKSQAGQPCSQVRGVPPCIYSINAFGPDEVEAYGPPPTWYRDGTQVKTWRLAPYSVAIWPYEEMYKDEVRNPRGTSPRYNAAARREAANAFFDQMDEDSSLVFYYANYSNALARALLQFAGTSN